MKNPDSPTNLISQKQFDQYTARWLTAVTSTHYQVLQRSLQPTDESASRMLSVTFSLQDLILLVSTVGASYIEARFLLKGEEEAGQLAENANNERFTIALYATDAHSNRVSAYYLAQDPPVSKSSNIDSTFTDDCTADDAQQVPHYVVRTWLINWQKEPELTPALFTTGYGPLQGYRFSLDDFKQPLFSAPSINNQPPLFDLRISFGLHKYYPAVPESLEPTRTFGLVLRLNSLSVAGEAQVTSAKPAEASTGKPNLAAESGEPFFDMSTPCPPGH
jgi:hypothetical protein